MAVNFGRFLLCNWGKKWHFWLNLDSLFYVALLSQKKTSASESRPQIGRLISGPQKGPEERGHVKNRPKVSTCFRNFLTFFAQGKNAKNRQKVSKMFSTLFDNIRAAPVSGPFWGGSDLSTKRSKPALQRPNRHLSGPLNRLNILLCLLHSLDCYRTPPPSGIGCAIGRCYLALSRVHTHRLEFSTALLWTTFGSSIARLWCYSWGI